MPVRNLRPFRTYEQRKGSILPIQHDWGPYEDAHSTTISSVTVQDADTGITVGAGSLSDSLWTSTITANQGGEHYFDLVGTFADGTKQVLQFRIDVFDRQQVW